ncbi:MAG: type I-E CRISPR-associated protein Cse2/CasB [Nitrospirota bacterium]
MNYIYLKDDDERQSLLAWWHSLNEKRGDRARLRRAETPDDVLLSEPFFHFLQRMPDDWATRYRLESSALVAATLAHVKIPQDDKSFATQLGTRKEGTDKPKMSELRFEQLQKSRNPEEFFRRLRRAVHLLNGTVNVLSLSDSILHWMKEYQYGVDRTPVKRLAVSWASDYYEKLPKS